MTKNGSALDQHTFNKLSRLYIIALSTIALSVIVSQVLVRKLLSDQEGDSRVVNIAGRQRMLSQKLTKDIVSLSVASSVENRNVLKNNLKETLNLWVVSHNALQEGSDSLGLPKKNSAKITAMFKNIDGSFKIIKQASNTIINAIEQEPGLQVNLLYDDINKVKQHENNFLVLMDGIVNQYDLEAKDKVNWLETLELLLMAITILLLLAEFLFIFWPAAKTVKNILSDLLIAERRAKKMAYDADVLSVAKEQSVKELRALSHAMDETLLFARTTPTGMVIHMGNKFSRLFKFNYANNTSFSKTISINENDQAFIDDVIAKHKKIGWQGEIKATIKSGDVIWLEMAIIPFNPTQEKSELLIIASDITKRKAGQIEIERLTQASFEERMSQQKIISSKIIESQEKEQNRIAKDVHDGLGQMLTGLKYNLESIDINNIDKTAVKIEELKVLTADIIKGVRTATFNLTPPELTDYGIAPAIAKLTKELAKLTGKQIVFFNKTDFNVRLDSLTEINIYRITQEAINNAIKYANSTHIIVSMSHSKKILSLVIDDNGKGFDPSNIKRIKTGDGGMGMTFMRERISYINGRFFITSEPGHGTRVTLNIPLL